MQPLVSFSVCGTSTKAIALGVVHLRPAIILMKMILQILYNYMKLTVGTLYPAYLTWKSLKRKNETTRRRWLKYWVNFSAFQVFELVADVTLAYIMPFYLEIKLLIVIWLVVGTRLIFDSIVDRELTKREKAIDKWLGRGKKAREEFLAVIWFEVSRCSIKILTTLMHGGLSGLKHNFPLIEEPNMLVDKQEVKMLVDRPNSEDEAEEEVDDEEDLESNSYKEPDRYKMDTRRSKVQ